jgi:hypothetical protein
MRNKGQRHPDGIITSRAFHPYGIITTEAFHWAGWAGRGTKLQRLKSFTPYSQLMFLNV